MSAGVSGGYPWAACRSGERGAGGVTCSPSVAALPCASISRHLMIASALGSKESAASTPDLTRAANLSLNSSLPPRWEGARDSMGGDDPASSCARGVSPSSGRDRPPDDVGLGERAPRIADNTPPAPPAHPPPPPPPPPLGVDRAVGWGESTGVEDEVQGWPTWTPAKVNEWLAKHGITDEDSPTSLSGHSHTVPTLMSWTLTQQTGMQCASSLLYCSLLQHL